MKVLSADPSVDKEQHSPNGVATTVRVENSPTAIKPITGEGTYLQGRTRDCKILPIVFWKTAWNRKTFGPRGRGGHLAGSTSFRFICLSIFLSVYLSVCLFVYPSICLSFCLYVCKKDIDVLTVFLLNFPSQIMHATECRYFTTRRSKSRWHRRWSALYHAVHSDPILHRGGLAWCLYHPWENTEYFWILYHTK